MNTYTRLLRYIKPYIKRLMLGILCMVIAAGAYVLVPWILKNIVDKVLLDKDFTTLNIIGVVILLLFLLRGFAVYGQNYSMAYVGQKVVIDIREAIYRHLQKLSLSFYDKSKTGTLMSNLTNDVAALQTTIVDNLIIAVTETAILLGSLGSMLYLDWRLTMLTLGIVPVVALIIDFFGKKLHSVGHEVQSKIADITALLQETISGIRVVRSFSREQYEIGRFQRENDNNFRAVMKATKLTSMLSPIVEFSASIAVTVIIWYGGYSVIKGYITSGALIAFLVYAINLSNPVKRLSQVYGNIKKSMAAAERIFSILDIEPQIKEKENAFVLPKVKGEVVFDEVSFSYNQDKVAISDLNICVKPGETIAIVGPSGAGKSTIANLLPRFYDVTAGRILIDGYDIKDVTFDSLREQIAIVPQETLLFNASVKDNILYGKLDASDEEVMRAVKAANAWEFIEKLPEGINTMVGERGSSLSGGQRQRIAIARALLKDPRILILDEATSALDTESEKVVQDALDNLMQGRTAIVIAHRLSTVRNADVIYVLQNGELKESGSHEELLAADGLYSYLYSVQFSDRE